MILTRSSRAFSCKLLGILTGSARSMQLQACQAACMDRARAVAQGSVIVQVTLVHLGYEYGY